MSNQQNCILLGVPLDSGKRRRGCLMGPDAYRTAGLERALRDLGHSVTDRGNVAPAPFQAKEHEKLHALEETIAWTESLAAAADAAAMIAALAGPAIEAPATAVIPAPEPDS